MILGTCSRAVLLDVLEALGDQRDAVIVVGAQAVYMHTGAIEMAVPEFTLDADITFDPALVLAIPEIEAAMLEAQFERGNSVGVWIASRTVAGVPARVEVDLMVPDAVGGPRQTGCPIARSREGSCSQNARPRSRVDRQARGHDVCP